MANGYGIETPANKIAAAQATLGLAMRLSAEVEAGRIGKSVYCRDVTIVTGGPGVRLPAFPEATDADLKNGIFNIVLIALSASALTVDETLDDVFGKAASDLEPSRVGIRVMVNQLRNAFAHNPWRPRCGAFGQPLAVGRPGAGHAAGLRAWHHGSRAAAADPRGVSCHRK